MIRKHDAAFNRICDTCGDRRADAPYPMRGHPYVVIREEENLALCRVPLGTSRYSGIPDGSSPSGELVCSKGE
jgi:hypothetical protein